jgi:hypothetical protein
MQESDAQLFQPGECSCMQIVKGLSSRDEGLFFFWNNRQQNGSSIA